MGAFTTPSRSLPRPTAEGRSERRSHIDFSRAAARYIFKLENCHLGHAVWVWETRQLAPLASKSLVLAYMDQDQRL